MFLPDGDDPRLPSKTGLHAIGGVLAHLRALTAITAPTVNSYRRFADAGFWAPIFADWGFQNRTTALRVSAPGRFEYRSVDSAVNPYLSMAGLLVGHAGRVGPEHGSRAARGREHLRSHRGRQGGGRGSRRRSERPSMRSRPTRSSRARCPAKCAASFSTTNETSGSASSARSATGTSRSTSTSSRDSRAAALAPDAHSSSSIIRTRIRARSRRCSTAAGLRHHHGRARSGRTHPPPGRASTSCSPWAGRWTSGRRASIPGWSAEKAAIRHWVADLGGPFLGVCLGHQLLAEALGGTVGPMEEPEIGVVEIAAHARRPG